MLILYPATLLNSFISSNSFGWRLQDFLFIISCHLQMVTVLFPSQIPFFYFCSYLFAVAKVINTVLNKISDSRNPCFCSQRKCFQLFTIKYDVNSDFVIYALLFIYLFIASLHIMQDPSSQTQFSGLETTPPAGESQFPNHLTIWGVHSLYYEKKV